MFSDKIKSYFDKYVKKEKNLKVNKESENVNIVKSETKKDIKNIGNDKKKIENLIFFIVICIITVFVINLIWNDSSSEEQDVESQNGKELASNLNVDIVSENSDNSIELELKNILSKISGVGDVEIYISYSESSEVIAMYNESSTTSVTEETDDSGGIRKIEETDSQKDIIYKEDSGDKTPMTQKVIEPKIEGAIIAAKGANNIDVKNNIIKAVEAVTGIATHKIQVFEMN